MSPVRWLLVVPTSPRGDVSPIAPIYRTAFRLVGDAPTPTRQLRAAFEDDLTRSVRLEADERGWRERALATRYHVLPVFREQL